jgi:multiple sugar transport system substrate-binding protein
MILAACVPAATPTAEKPPEVPKEEPPEQPEEEEVVEIVYMRQAEGIDLEMEFIEEFNNSHPNINVTVDSVPAGENYSKLALTTESGTPPDVYMTYWTLGAATNGLAYDLSDFVAEDGQAYYDSFVKPSWTFNEYDGKQFGVPYRVAPVSVIVNKRMVESKGLELPPNDWNWNDFVEYAKLLTDEEAGEYGYCLTGSAESHGTDAQFYPYLFSNGGKMINEQCLADFNSPEGVEALEFMVDIVNNQGIVPPGTMSTSNNTCIDMLAADKVAMWIDASLWLGFIRAGRPDVDITLAPFPCGSVCATDNGGTGFGMASKTKHPEEAWELIKFLASDDVQKRWAMEASWTPGNVAVLEDEEFLADKDQATVAYVLDNYKVWPLSHYPDNANLEAVLRTYLQAAYLGEMTAQEALDGAAEEWNEVLKDYQEDDWCDVWK